MTDDDALNPEQNAPADEVKSPEASEPAAASPETAPVDTAQAPSSKRWYIVKVQSGREESIKEAIERKVKIEGLEECFGQIIIPTETITEVRNGKRRQKEHKLFPGYIMAEVELVDATGHLNDRVLYLFRETSGVGDFVGGDLRGMRAPPPMSEREVERMLHIQKAKGAGTGAEPTREVRAKPKFNIGDRLKVTNGTFVGMEGDVREILEDKGQVRLELPILGRPIPVELEYWQVEPA